MQSGGNRKKRGSQISLADPSMHIYTGEPPPSPSSVTGVRNRSLSVLRKKELKEEYWPRLLKSDKKMHFLKTNFDKWVDEDEQNEVPEDDDYMSRMAGMGGGDGGFGGIDFSKLGAGAGGDMGAMGAMGGMGGAGDDSDDEDLPEDDDEMPPLEGDDEKVADAGDKGKAKIEEVE